MNIKRDLVQGMRDGFPIGLGNAPVAFTFDLLRFQGDCPYGLRH